jgi:hypothetical protein
MSAADRPHRRIDIRTGHLPSYIIHNTFKFQSLSNMALSRLVAALFFSQCAFSSPVMNRQVPSNSSLTWQPCQLDFPPEDQEIITAHGAAVYCATLPVPLDYTDLNSGGHIALQLVKVEATKQPFKGSVIMNPGGPGNSGVEEVSKYGPTYRDVFGGNFDVIGFDAR